MAKDKDDLLDYDEDRPGGGVESFWDVLKTWGPAIIAVLAIRSSVIEPFRIPSGSMVPTLEIGDHIMVTKFSYELRLPFTKLKLLSTGEPAPGDVVVFEYPPNPKLDYIKRIVATAGDTVQVKDNVLYVNDEVQTRTYVEQVVFKDDSCREETVKAYREELDGQEHWILNSTAYGRSSLANYPATTVPEGHVFAMGDNRDNSADSRVWGFVPLENIKGKAHFIWLSYDACYDGPNAMPLFGQFRWERFGLGLYE